MRDAVRLRSSEGTFLDTPATRRHLDETVRIWLGLPNDAGVEIPRLPDELARVFLRVEEYERPHRDSYGCWEFGFSENFRSGRLWEPEVDQWLAERRRELGQGIPLEPSWPDSHPFALCLTHDVDLVSAQSTLPQVLRFMRAGLAGAAGPPRERLVRLARPPVRAARALRSGVSSRPSTDTTLALSVAVEKEYGSSAHTSSRSTRHNDAAATTVSTPPQIRAVLAVRPAPLPTSCAHSTPTASTSACTGASTRRTTSDR